MRDLLATTLGVHSSVEITVGMAALVCLLVMFASCVDAIAGGGGLISLPAYLLTGLPPVVASGSNKFSASFGTLMATARYMAGKKLRVAAGLIAVLGALPGAYVGAELQKMVPEEIMRVFMLAAIPVVGVVLFIKRGAEPEPRPLTRGRLAFCLLIGLGCGLYDGFFGPGTGTFLILLFTYIVGMDMVTASGTAKLVNLASNCAALVAFVRSGDVVYLLAVPAMVCSVIGGFIGAQLAIFRGTRFIRVVMMGVLALLLVWIARGLF